MAQSLTAWRESLQFKDSELSQKHIDDFILAAHEGFRVMAMKHNHDPDSAADIAQSCTLSLLKRANSGQTAPFSPETIDMLNGGSLKLESSPFMPGSQLGFYLCGLLRYAVIKHDKSLQKRKRTTVSLEEDQNDGLHSEPHLTSKPDNVLGNVSNSLNTELAIRIHDKYLDDNKHGGRRLRDVFGDWTPIHEWSGMCDTKDRPDKKTIPETTLRRHMDNIKDLILCAKNSTVPFASPNDKNL